MSATRNAAPSIHSDTIPGLILTMASVTDHGYMIEFDRPIFAPYRMGDWMMDINRPVYVLLAASKQESYHGDNAYITSEKIDLLSLPVGFIFTFFFIVYQINGTRHRSKLRIIQKLFK